jgi:signal peptidase I
VRSRAVIRIIGWLCFVVAFLALAPVQMGGAVHYLTIRGMSMEPNIHAGDVVVVRRQQTYNVGDVIAYHSDMDGAVVLHRVIGAYDDRYVMRGDNNGFVDQYQPSIDDVVGRKVAQVPGGAQVLHFVAKWRAVIVPGACALGLLIAVTNRSSQRTRRGRHRRLRPAH